MGQLCRLSARWLPAAGRPPEKRGLQTCPRIDVDLRRRGEPDAPCLSRRALDADEPTPNTLSVDGDADAAVEARIRIGWNKFRQLVPLLTNKDMSDYERKVVQ